MAFIERESELSRLKRLVDSFSDNPFAVETRIFLLQGAAGMGRTELAYQFADHATQRGMTVLFATGIPQERALPFGIIAQFLYGGTLPRDNVDAELAASTAAELERMLATLVFDATVPLDVRTIGRVVHLATTWLTRLAQSTPTLVVIDDIQHADPHSLQCIRHLTRKSRSARGALLITNCQGSTPVDPLFLTELKRERNSQIISLEPLSARGVATLLTERLGAGAERLAEECHAITGGNPLLVQGLLDDQQTAPEQADLVIGEAFGHALISCMHHTDSDAHRLTRAVVALGDSADAELLDAVLDFEHGSAARLIQALTAAGVLSGNTFRHPVGAATIRASTPAAEIARVNYRAAELMHRNGHQARAVAERLLVTGFIRQPWVVGVLEEAAEEANRGGQPQFAISCLELAYDSCTDEQHQAVIKAKLADTMWHVKPSAAVKHLAHLTSATKQGRLVGHHAIANLRYLLWHGQFDTAAEALTYLSSAASTRRDPSTVVEMQIIRLSLCSTHPPVLAELRQAQPTGVGEQQTPVPITLEARLNAATMLATVLMHGATEAEITRAEEVLQRISFGDKSPESVEAAVAALLGLIYADRVDLAARWCDLLQPDLAIRHSAAWRAMLAGTRSEIALRQGDLAGAVEQATVALTVMEPGSWGIGVGAPLASLIMANTAMGRYDEVADLVRQPVPEAMFQTRYGLHYLFARGHYHLAAGRHYAALADFMGCGELMRAWGLDQPALVPWRISAVAAWQRLGNREKARRLAADQLARLSRSRTRSRAIVLQGMAEVSDPAQQRQLLREAADIFDECGDLLGKASALAGLSRSLQELGEQGPARTMALRAWHLARECQAFPLCAELFPGRLDVSPDGGNEAPQRITRLSEAERKVAALAAEGYQNREIALKLFITVSTVEQHLTRVYRKLNLRNRKDLPTSLYAGIGGIA